MAYGTILNRTVPYRTGTVPYVTVRCSVALPPNCQPRVSVGKSHIQKCTVDNSSSYLIWQCHFLAEASPVDSVSGAQHGRRTPERTLSGRPRRNELRGRMRENRQREPFRFRQDVLFLDRMDMRRMDGAGDRTLTAPGFAVDVEGLQVTTPPPRAPSNSLDGGFLGSGS